MLIFEFFIKALLVLLWLGVIPFILGDKLVKENGLTAKDMFLTYIFGWFKMFAWFQIIAIPFIFLRFSLSTLVIVWVVGIMILLTYNLIINGKDYLDIINRKWKVPNLNFIEVIGIGLVAFQLLAITILTHEDADDAFFIGQAVTDNHTNTMLQYAGDTGAARGILPSRYVLAPFPTFLAAISRLVMINPVTLGRVIFQVVFMVMCYMAFYLLLTTFFDDDRKKAAIGLCFVCLLNIWGNISVFTTSSFLIFRLHQGKALLANLILPFMIYLLIQYYRNHKYNQKEMLLVMVSATLVSSMGVYLAPLLHGAYTLVQFVKDRKFATIKTMVISCLPAIVIGIIFLIIR